MTVKQPKVYQLFCAPSVFMGFGIWKFCRKFLCRSCHVQVRCVKLQEYRLSWLRVSKTDVSITKYRSKVSAFDLFHAPCMPFCTNLEVAVDVWKLTQSCQQIPIELRQYFAFFLLQVGYIYLIICTQILFIYMYTDLHNMYILYLYTYTHLPCFMEPLDQKRCPFSGTSSGLKSFWLLKELPKKNWNTKRCGSRVRYARCKKWRNHTVS